MPVHIRKPQKPKSREHPKWISLREEFVSRNASGDTIGVAEFAREKGINFGSVKKQAYETHWMDSVRDRIAKTSHAVSTELTKRSIDAIDQLRSSLAETEASVRARHVRLGQKLQVMAINHLDKPDTKLTSRDAVDLLRLGIGEERRGMGLPDVYVSQTTNYNLVMTKAQEAFENHLRAKGGAAQAVQEALKVIEGEYEVVPDAGTPSTPV